MPIERRGNAPDPAASVAKFDLFFLAVLDEAVRRIGDDSVD